MENNKTVAPETIAQIKMWVAVFWLMVTGVASLFFPPFIILTAYYIFQAIFRLAVYTQNSFIEKMLFGPIRLAVGGFMIMAGIPTDNNILAIVWIGISLMFVVSGCRNLSAAIRLGQSGAANATPVPTQTARQRDKSSKAEDALYSDLTDFLSDSSDK